jgi:sodium pump decarboxylase gamma subunit
MGNFAPFSAESWSYAGQMTLLGMGMVFAVLGLLWMILTVFKLVFVGKDKNKSSLSSAEESRSQRKAAAPRTNTVTEVASQPSVQSDEEIAAVITAAITAYMAEQGIPADGFRVVSFKRVKNGRSWNGK